MVRRCSAYPLLAAAVLFLVLLAGGGARAKETARLKAQGASLNLAICSG